MGAGMTTATDLFLEDARGVSVLDGYYAAGGRLQPRRGRTEIDGPCIHDASSKDAFSINPGKNAWNCRRCGRGGRDALSIAAHELGYDLSSRGGLMDACAIVTGKPIPDGAEAESPAERAAREEALRQAREANARAAEARERDQAGYRDRERAKAIGIYEHADRLDRSPLSAGRDYLRGRGAGVPDDHHLRVAASVTYWHGQDERGHPVDIHCGPAMIAPFVDAAGIVIGCHITWIDLGREPKLRPHLLDEEGEPLPTKKMRGTKKGGLIPLYGDRSLVRWLGGEGIENTLAVARAEGFRADTFYFAAGDLGNLSGPADQRSRFKHPELTKADKAGRERPVMIAGPDPDEARLDQGFPVDRHVEECVLVADADSEPLFTAAAMARARRRVEMLVTGILVPVLWPPAGIGDFAILMQAQ